MSVEGKPGAMLRSAAWMAWSGSVSIANSVVLWVLFARWRETSELGQFTVVMSVNMIFMTLCALGLAPYLSGEVARRNPGNDFKDTHAFISSAVIFLFAWAVVCAALMSLSGLIVSQSAEVRLAIAILSISMLPTGLIAVAEPVCTAFGQTRLIALVTTLENLLRTLLPLWLLYSGRGMTAICISFVGVRFIAGLVYLFAARHHLNAIALARWSVVREITSHAPTFAGVAILSSLHFQLAAVLIGRLHSETEAAEFGAASRFLIPVMVLMGSYMSVVQPTAARLAAVSLPQLGAFISRSLQLILLLTMPCAIGMLLLAREVLTLLYGEKLVTAASSLSFLALSIIPFGAVMIIARGLIATGNQRIDLLGNFIAVTLNLLLNLLLIPRLGATGAAVAQFVSLLALLLIALIWSSLRLYQLDASRAVLTCAVPLMLMISVIWFVRVHGFWVAALTGAVVYLGCVALTQRDLRFVITRL